MSAMVKPRVIVGGALVVVTLILLSLAQEMNRRWQVQREVQRLESEVQLMEKSVIELQNVNQYFRTPDFQERLAREKLNYRAPGEEVVLIPEQDLAANEDIEVIEEAFVKESLPLLWWKAFFVQSDLESS